MQKPIQTMSLFGIWPLNCQCSSWQPPSQSQVGWLSGKGGNLKPEIMGSNMNRFLREPTFVISSLWTLAGIKLSFFCYILNPHNYIRVMLPGGAARIIYLPLNAAAGIRSHVSRVAPTRDLWRTLNQMSYPAAAISVENGIRLQDLTQNSMAMPNWSQA